MGIFDTERLLHPAPENLAGTSMSIRSCVCESIKTLSPQLIMRFFTAVLAAIALAVPALAAPTTLHAVQKYNGETTGRYIVKLKDGVSKASVLGEAKAKSTHADWKIINGFASELDEETLNALRAHPDVEYIEEDGIMHAFDTQTDAPWGLSRLSSTYSLSGYDDSALDFSYTYDSSSGYGVDIYVVDTGILTTHSQFGGRAYWGATFGGYADADGNGHGTHCAGTAAGSQFGVAKAATLIAVKVLSDQGSGAVSDIVSGLDWVLSSAQSTGAPSVVSMSLGGSASTSLDNAVAKLTNGGVHVAVAAGNSNTDAGSTSPARAPSAVTVGATDINDSRASFSNYGSVVDIFAPGVNVISSWIGSDYATNEISGTSMATPHISGLIAYLIGLNGNVSPATMSSNIKSLALKGVLYNIPSGTVNYLAHNQ
ncbi:putative peptidase S8 family protein [Lyophyllum shimeji]|uniref:Peptidase S8 family protein n=1 Tax=Lyophyllum shimeji TaxID=47721 RepID=A0A9P3URV5_LYOSH|nr:putative peptidase S8 family protein [Lyophyllum shimeji]